jgi:6-phosphogluconolactonase
MSITGYIGTYTEAACNGRARGIYSFSFDPGRGTLEHIRLCAESVNPTYLALGPGGKRLYAVNEVDNFNGGGNGAGDTGAVSAFAVEGDGLSLINQVSSGGKGPCHIVLNKAGTWAIVANYSGGRVAALPIKIDGSLEEAAQIIAFSGGTAVACGSLAEDTGSGPNRERQEAPHAHFFMFDKDETHGFAFDLGTDRVMAYAFGQAPGNNSAEGQGDKPLVPAAEPWFSAENGAGPRHGVFHPRGKTAYFINELDSTVNVLSYEPVRGAFSLQQTLSTLPPGAQVMSTCAAIRLRPDGKYVYASNRGHDSIAVFKVGGSDAEELSDGAENLRFLDATPSGGRTPRDFILNPEPPPSPKGEGSFLPAGRFLLACNQDSDNVTVFRVDEATGLLEKIGDYAVPSPVCVIFG